MIVYHVTSIKKLLKYIQNRRILPPIRAWQTIEEAERFSIQTGRQIILRLRFPDNSEKLEGHRNKAVLLNESLDIGEVFGGWKP